MFAPPLAELALKFGPAEYFSLMVLGLIAAIVLARGSLIKAIAMVVLGLLLGLIGTDVNSGVAALHLRHSRAHRRHRLRRGRDGHVRLSREIIAQPRAEASKREVFTSKVTDLYADQGRLQAHRGRRSCAAPRSARCLGILPGGGALLASFARLHAGEEDLAASASTFGKGAIEGVAAPRVGQQRRRADLVHPACSRSASRRNAVMALMIGAMIIHGIQPGPQVMTEKPELFWGMIASMWVGNLMLVVLNLPLIGMWVKLLTVPYR